MNASRTRRAALYVRVSTDRQTVENQVAKLTEVATARGWQIVATFTDAGISGAKGRKDRPGLDDMLNQAQRGKFDVVMAWAIDRVGRSGIWADFAFEIIWECRGGRYTWGDGSSRPFFL